MGPRSRCDQESHRVELWGLWTSRACDSTTSPHTALRTVLGFPCSLSFHPRKSPTQQALLSRLENQGTEAQRGLAAFGLQSGSRICTSHPCPVLAPAPLSPLSRFTSLKGAWPVHPVFTFLPPLSAFPLGAERPLSECLQMGEWMRECMKKQRDEEVKEHGENARLVHQQVGKRLPSPSESPLRRRLPTSKALPPVHSPLFPSLFLPRQEREWRGVPEEEGGSPPPPRGPSRPRVCSRARGPARRQQLEEDHAAHPGHHHPQHPR